MTIEATDPQPVVCVSQMQGINGMAVASFVLSLPGCGTWITAGDHLRGDRASADQSVRTVSRQLGQGRSGHRDRGPDRPNRHDGRHHRSRRRCRQLTAMHQPRAPACADEPLLSNQPTIRKTTPTMKKILVLLAASAACCLAVPSLAWANGGCHLPGGHWIKSSGSHGVSCKDARAVVNWLLHDSWAEQSHFWAHGRYWRVSVPWWNNHRMETKFTSGRGWCWIITPPYGG